MKGEYSTLSSRRTRAKRLTWNTVLVKAYSRTFAYRTADPGLESRREWPSWNHGTSANKSSYVESSFEIRRSWVDSYWGEHLSSKAMTRTLQNFERMTSQAWPHWRNEKRGWGSRPNPPAINAAMRSPRRGRLFEECRSSRRSRSSWGSQRKPFTSLVAKRWICSKQLASMSA